MNKLKKFTANDKALLSGTTGLETSRVAYTDIAIVVLNSEMSEMHEYVLEVILPDYNNEDNYISYYKLLGTSVFRVAEKVGNSTLTKIDSMKSAEDIIKYLKSQRFVKGM